ESLARRPEGVEVDGFILNLARIADANTKFALSIDPNERFRDAWYSIDIKDAGTRVELDWYHGVDREPFLPHGGCNPPADGFGGSISVYTGSCENLVDLQLMKTLKIPEAERGTLYYVTTSDNERIFIRCAAYESCLYRS